jgi:hypothetical protein
MRRISDVLMNFTCCALHKVIHCLVKVCNSLIEDETHNIHANMSISSNGIIDSELFNMFVISTLEQQSEIQPVLGTQYVDDHAMDRHSRCSCQASALKYYHEFVQSCGEVSESDRYEICPICRENFNFKKEIINELCCGHLLHNKCLNSYAYNLVINKKSINCPLCRAALS